MRAFGWLSVVGLTLALASGPALAVPVDVELLMLVDVSGTISDAEFELMRDDIAAGVRDASDSLPSGGVAINVMYWGQGILTSALIPSTDPGSEPDMPIGWAQINNPGDADALATQIESTTRDLDPDPLFTNTGGLTSIGDAINTAFTLFDDNGFESDTFVIDVMGDGTENFQLASSGEFIIDVDFGGGSLSLPFDPMWGAVEQAVAAANAAGAVVNGLPIRPVSFDPPTDANGVTEVNDAKRVSERILSLFFSNPAITGTDFILANPIVLDPVADPGSAFNTDFTAEQRAAIIGALEDFEADLIAALGLEQAELTYHEWFFRQFATGGDGSFVEVAENNGDIRRAVADKLRAEFGLPEPSAALLLAVAMGALLRRRA